MLQGIFNIVLYMQLLPVKSVEITIFILGWIVPTAVGIYTTIVRNYFLILYY